MRPYPWHLHCTQTEHLSKPLAVTHILPQWERLGQKQNFALSCCFSAKLISFLTAITQCAELRELSPEMTRVLDAIKSVASVPGDWLICLTVTKSPQKMT